MGAKEEKLVRCVTHMIHEDYFTSCLSMYPIMVCVMRVRVRVRVRFDRQRILRKLPTRTNFARQKLWTSLA